ncbi:MAG TPA: hypothetical protein VGO40_01715 [Longimicrobium sp.]|jgi:hypothetical protein|nr:hypothetical protein [Longimicrobium sp.]
MSEIRDLGSGGYRLFFFWNDAPEVKELFVTHALPKRGVVGRGHG